MKVPSNERSSHKDDESDDEDGKDPTEPMKEQKKRHIVCMTSEWVMLIRQDRVFGWSAGRDILVEILDRFNDHNSSMLASQFHCRLPSIILVTAIGLAERSGL